MVNYNSYSDPFIWSHHPLRGCTTQYQSAQVLLPESDSIHSHLLSVRSIYVSYAFFQNKKNSLLLLLRYIFRIKTRTSMMDVASQHRLVNSCDSRYISSLDSISIHRSAAKPKWARKFIMKMDVPFLLKVSCLRKR